MFKKLGLGAVFTFNSTQAEAAMSRTHHKFFTLQTDTKLLNRGISQVGRGMRTLSMVGTGLAVGLGLGARAGIHFEQQMANVQAVLMTTKKHMAGLAQQAMNLGSSTQYTATQVGQAQEMLARAGFRMNEILKATPGILYAAAAAGMPLAEMADTVAVNLRAFGLAASQTSQVADMLNKTTTLSAINMTDLAESMKYAAPYAHNAGISLKETLAVMAAMGNVGIKGTMAGTSFGQMLVHLSKLTPEAQKALRGLGVTFQDVHGNMLPVGKVVQNFMAGLGQLRGNMAKTRLVAEVFGIRGAKAIQGMMAAMDTKHARSYGEILKEIGGSAGTALKMASIRLDTLHGKWILFKSALEGALIGIYNTYKSTIGPIFGHMVDGLQYIALGIRGVRVQVTRDAKGVQHELNVTTTAAWKVGRGIHDAFSWGIRQVHAFETAIKKMVNSISKSTGMGVRQIATLAGKIALSLAAIGPAMLALAGVGKVLGPLIGMASGLGKILMALPGPLKIVAVLLGVALAGGAMKGEKGMSGLMDAMKGIWQAVQPLIPILRDNLVVIFGLVADTVRQLAPVFGDLIKAIVPLVIVSSKLTFGVLREALRYVVPAVKTLTAGLSQLVGVISSVITGTERLGSVTENLNDHLAKTSSSFGDYLKQLYYSFNEFSTIIVKGTVDLVQKGLSALMGYVVKWSSLLIAKILDTIAKNKAVSWLAKSMGLDLQAEADRLRRSTLTGKQRADIANTQASLRKPELGVEPVPVDMNHLLLNRYAGKNIIPPEKTAMSGYRNFGEYVAAQSGESKPQQITVHTQVKVDSKEIAKAVGRGVIRQDERRGRVATPEERQIRENGGTPTKKYGNLAIEAVW